MNEERRTQEPPDRNLISRWTPWIAVLVIVALGGVIFTAVREAGRDRQPAGLDPAFVHDVSRYRNIPAAQIGYREVARIQTGLEHATALVAPTVLVHPSCNSWYNGGNVPGKKRMYMGYTGGIPEYRRRCDEVAATGYAGFKLR